MKSIKNIIKSFALESNLSESMILRIDIILDLFDEILLETDKDLYYKIISSLNKIFSDHIKNDMEIRDFDIYFGKYNNEEIWHFEFRGLGEIINNSEIIPNYIDDLIELWKRAIKLYNRDYDKIIKNIKDKCI